MKRTLVASAAAMAALLLIVLPAYGTPSKQPVFSPKKGGIYIGTIKSTFDLAITMKVSRTGKSARISWLCGTGRAPTSAPNVPIDSTTGTFKASSSTNTWILNGRFVSATQARITLNNITCGGSKGTTKLTLK